MVPLCVVAGIIVCTWSENYGNQNMPLLNSLSRGFELLRSEPKIAALGLAQSSFEGAMYTFVFMWTSSLKSGDEIEHEENNRQPEGEHTAQFLGLIFAIFMVCVMIGSTLFKIHTANSKENLYRLPLYVHSTACLSMLVTALSVGKYPTVVFMMFLLFETCVGGFYPTYGCIKSERIPEEIRASVMNIFR